MQFFDITGAANGLRYLRWGGRRSRPARKMIRRVKLPEICAESPASGARFVGTLYGVDVNVAVPIIFGVGIAMFISVISLAGNVIYRNALFGVHESK